jgi:glutamine amidotransferase
MIAIVDYGASNLSSVKKAIDWLGREALVTSDAAVVARADRIILPGVGHFSATTTLTASGLRTAIEAAIAHGVPLLGICLGMQWLFKSSQEAPHVQGLGAFDGECEHFPSKVKSPHVGWNQLEIRRSSRLFVGVPTQAFVYYTHSYRAPLVNATVAASEYGGAFSAAVERDRIFGVQFHPEKSGPAGLQLLENFCTLPC